MSRYRLGLLTLLILCAGSVFASPIVQDQDETADIKIGLLLQPYTGSRGGSDLSDGPKLMLPATSEVLKQQKAKQAALETIRLTAEEEKDYGVWHRVGLANGHLGHAAAPMIKKGLFPIGLLGNCNSLTGMLAGLQHSGSSRKAQRVGLIWMDAHGDYNTPETTLSGMLGGMPVAVAAGKCLWRLRLKAGLDPAISTRNIIMMGLRDVDPLEQDLIDDSFITCVATPDMVEQSQLFKDAVAQLAQQVDVIYVHIDLDVLDAADIPGHTFEIPEGPTAPQLGAALEYIMQEEKVKALGIASFPTPEAGRERCLQSLKAIITGTISGLKMRE